MKGTLPLLFALLGGCGYLGQRGNDFADCWRAEYSMGGPSVWVHAGPLLHTGLGKVDVPSGHELAFCAGVGFRYNLPGAGFWDDCPETFCILHDTEPRDGEKHRCFAILPGLLYRGAPDRSPLHLWDVDVGATAFLVGCVIGFSPGEFLDFLLGWFGIDIAGDDSVEGRAGRSIYPILPRPSERTLETLEGMVVEGESPGAEVRAEWPPTDVRPVSGARIRVVSSAATWRTETDRTGAFAVRGAGDAAWERLRVECDGYQPLEIPASARPPAAQRLLIRLVRND